jgi:hypothetical protein
LQAGRGVPGALFYQIERKAAHLVVLFFLENLEAVDDRADWTDHVMADARAEQSGQVESIERKIRHIASFLRVGGKAVTRLSCHDIAWVYAHADKSS